MSQDRRGLLGVFGLRFWRRWGGGLGLEGGSGGPAWPSSARASLASIASASASVSGSAPASVFVVFVSSPFVIPVSLAARCSEIFAATMFSMYFFHGDVAVLTRGEPRLRLNRDSMSLTTHARRWI